MKEYDVIVIGAGDVGLGIIFKAVSRGLKVALIEKGNVGGTCINVGCVPSKTLLASADRIMEIREAGKLGVQANIMNIDFPFIMRRMKDAVESGRNAIRGALTDSRNLDFYGEEGHFTGEYTLRAKNTLVRGKKIFIASGARPFIPSIKGLDSIEYLTNESVLELKKIPESIIIMGGGYVAVEYAHFFAAMGSKVTVVERSGRLVAGEEPEISALLKKELGKRIEIHTDTEIVEVAPHGGFAVLVKDRSSGEEREIFAEQILVATGRKSNADLLRVEKTGVETDERDFIKVNDYLQTNKQNIWALGDAIGKQMFTHAGDREAEIAWHNATHKKRKKMDFFAVPHAVFTYPQIASIGLTEEEAKKRYGTLVGRAKYSDTVKGTAMGEEEGFAKAIVEKKTKGILGFHIIGPDASVLIQEVANAVASKSDITSLTGSMHVFPALSDVITETLNNLEQ
ncbi:MAG: dihydrolipoyl dehydrogenase [Nitrospirae bacterium]|nr:dihydrolipoyl dehydrogenase [Nitrospirota bacterium]MCL5421720.1 dihydrolipoyl dehydrogenase [Nitrospirota bacterium]